MRPIQYLRKTLWAPTPPDRSLPVRAVFHAGRLVDRLFDDIYTGRLNLYAMSLVYTTLLSIVPVLAVSFSVLKAFGVHNQLEPTLLTFLAPLGPKGVELTNQVIGFVDNIRVGVLGFLGLGFLIYTVISLMQKVEQAFNYIWRTRRERTLSRRFSDYLSVILVGPVLVFTALGITGSAMNTEVMQWLAAHEPAKTIITASGRLVPIMLIVAAFTFIYKLVPYTRVSLQAAFIGALVAGVLWESAGLAFASFIAASTRYTAIYSSFAIGILAIIWLYLAWLILLVGCRIAFYQQHPEHLWVRETDSGLSPRQTEVIALRAMIHIGRHFSDGEGVTEIGSLAGAIGTTETFLERVLGTLEAKRLLVVVDHEEPAYVPGAPLEQITAADVLRAVRGDAPSVVPDCPADAVAEDVLDEFEASLSDNLRQRSLAELVAQSEPAPDRELRAAGA
ncbi:MAG TPA: YhjD/YihY/BrkB family envelope integrity protein [Arenicellales bacterium]|nr:YhjD/YihY/BrkB family envelope integrity protein [Arenicellales bacterium]